MKELYEEYFNYRNYLLGCTITIPTVGQTLTHSNNNNNNNNNILMIMGIINNMHVCYVADTHMYHKLNYQDIQHNV